KHAAAASRLRTFGAILRSGPRRSENLGHQVLWARTIAITRPGCTRKLRRLPRALRAIPTCIAEVTHDRLLQILHLFADLLDQHLQVYRQSTGAAVHALGAEGIGFAIEFLQQKVQTS